MPTCVYVGETNDTVDTHLRWLGVLGWHLWYESKTRILGLFFRIDCINAGHWFASRLLLRPAKGIRLAARMGRAKRVRQPATHVWHSPFFADRPRHHWRHLAKSEKTCAKFRPQTGEDGQEGLQCEHCPATRLTATDRNATHCQAFNHARSSEADLFISIE